MQDTPTYGMGQLAEAFTKEALDLWRAQYARSMSMSQAREQLVAAVEVQWREGTGGVVSVLVTVESHRRRLTDSYYWRVIRKGNNLYEVDPRSVA